MTEDAGMWERASTCSGSGGTSGIAESIHEQASLKCKQFPHMSDVLKVQTGERQSKRGSGVYLPRVKSLKLCSLRKTVR